MRDWFEPLKHYALRGEPCVLVTVANTRGSTPREVGAKMLVSQTEIGGSIGGGQLEHQCIELARKRLGDWPGAGAAMASFSRTFTLGAGCGQCCGGVAEILFERIDVGSSEWVLRLGEFMEREEPVVIVTATAPEGGSKLLAADDVVYSSCAGQDMPERVLNIARQLLSSDFPAQKKTVNIARNVKVSLLFEPIRPAGFNIFLFGAGHVGSALTRILAEVPCTLTVIDSRAALLQGKPAAVKLRASEAPYLEVDRAPAGTYFLVMTHSHPLDQEICNRILARGDFAYCGLIGSRSKRRRFEKRFRALGIAERSIEALTCPIGVESISGKRPGEIAIAVAAQLLTLRQQGHARGTQRPQALVH